MRVKTPSRRVWRPALAALALLLVAQAAAAPGFTLTPDIRGSMAAIRPESLRAHLRYLADDLLEGRDTVTRGTELAARYLASQLETMGLAPAGDDGSYLQQVRLERARLDETTALLSLTTGTAERPFRIHHDFFLTSQSFREADLAVPLVFAGYGIAAPEFHYDDYAGLEVKGKAVLVLSGEPPSEDEKFFDGSKETPYASASRKMAQAAERGAAALVVLVTDRGRASLEQLARIATFERLSLAAAEDRDPIPVLLMPSEAAPEALAGQALTWTAALEAARQRTLKPQPLEGRLRLRLQRTRQPVSSPNVVAMRTGIDPQLKNQVVVYSAHYDHVGTGRAVNGDAIYNGAWDNASGTAELLEVARAFATLKRAPRRSVLFLFVTGEERGFFGSRYYVSHPRFPMKDTAANINLDMTEIFGVPLEIVAQGAERSTLIGSAQAVADLLKLKLGTDPSIDYVGNVYGRSDQIIFARAGVPAVFLRWSGTHVGLTPEESKKRAQERFNTIYHRPSDAFDPNWSWEGMQRHGQIAFLFGLHVANQTEMPAWNPDDEFAKVQRQ